MFNNKKDLNKILDTFNKVEVELEQFITENGDEIDKKEKELAAQKEQQSRASRVLAKLQQLIG